VACTKVFFFLFWFTVAASAQPADKTVVSYFANVRQLEASEAAHSDDASIETDLALNLFLLGQRELFHAAIARALEINPGLAQAYYLAGRFALEAEQDPSEASRNFQKALELDPSSFKAHYFLGISLRQLVHFQAARDEFKKATESSGYSWPFSALAETDLDLNDPQAALEPALKAIELEPQSADNSEIAGRVYHALGQDDKAIQMYQQAAKLDPLLETPHFLLGNLYAARPETKNLSGKELELFRQLKEQDAPAGAEAAMRSQSPRRAPQVKTRLELDSFGAILLAKEPLAVIRASEDFLSRFPDSEFRENALKSEFEAFRKRNDYSAARRVAGMVLALNPAEASVLAESALMIADKNDASGFLLADEYAARAVQAAKASARPDRMSRTEFQDWKTGVLASALGARGLLALRRQEADAALVSLNEAVKLRPDGPNYLRLAEALAMKGEVQRAREAFAHAESLGPDVVARAARLQAAALNGEAGSAPSATSVTARFEHARSLEKEGKLQDAAAEYELIVRQDPNLAEANHNLGLVYYRLADYESCAERLRAALRLKPNLAGSHLFLGLAEFRLGEFQDSAKHLEAALQIEPDNREALLFLLRNQLALGRFRLETANHALSVFPGDSEVNYTVGLACIDRIREIARATNELGQDSAAFVWLSLRRAEQRQQVDAVRKYQLRAAKLAEPALIREYDVLADLLKRCFDGVLTHDPDSAAAHSIRGYMHESRNEVEEALTQYRAGGDHFAAGRLLAQNVRLREAEEELRAAVAADAQNDRAKADLGRLYLQEDQPEKARAILRQIVERYPRDAYAWADLGKAEGKLGAGDTAIQALQKALQIDPSLNQVHYQLAMLYRQRGNEKLALEELERFRTNRKSDP
jgi:tetratricopeptide (TPR) repeat protein